MVERRIERPQSATGGHFSVGYIARREQEPPVFVKALDLASVFDDPGLDVFRALEALTTAFNFERDLLQKCRDSRMTRVVTPIAEGALEVDGFPSPRSHVRYLVFEMADGDIRSRLDASAAFDLALKLRSLHHIATGVQQLHSKGIAHQDMKPSNVLMFKDAGSKVADLGRACVRGTLGPYDGLLFPGDYTYAPPEVLYGFQLPDWESRRFGADAYLLGSVVHFLFVRVGMTAALTVQMDPSNHWERWGDGFEAVLPFLQAAFEEVLRGLEAATKSETEQFGSRIVGIVRELCNPDPRHRGHPRDRGQQATQFDLRRYVTELDLLARRAELYRLRS